MHVRVYRFQLKARKTKCKNESRKFVEIQNRKHWTERPSANDGTEWTEQRLVEMSKASTSTLISKLFCSHIERIRNINQSSAERDLRFPFSSGKQKTKKSKKKSEPNKFAFYFDSCFDENRLRICRCRLQRLMKNRTEEITGKLHAVRLTLLFSPFLHLSARFASIVISKTFGFDLPQAKTLFVWFSQHIYIIYRLLWKLCRRLFVILRHSNWIEKRIEKNLTCFARTSVQLIASDNKNRTNRAFD